MGEKEAVEKILGEIGVEVKIEEVRRLGRIGKEKEGTVWVKLENLEQKKEVMEKKKLKGRKERITDDWTWRERRMRWKLEQIAGEEERRGGRVVMGYGRVRIEGEWWKWDEREEILKNGGGDRRGKAGKGGEGDWVGGNAGEGGGGGEAGE